jgi:hypothetical protein
MPYRRRDPWAVLLLACVLPAVAPACSAKTATRQAATGPTVADGLGNLRDMFRQAAAGKATLPKSAAEFTAVEPFYPVAGPYVLSGAIDCAWGAGLKEGVAAAAAKRLAWDKGAAEAGGWVLFQDGTIREVTAAEFAAAAKATP